MQSVQRHFGRFMKRTADSQQVSVLLKDFEDADQLLSKIVEEAKRWREAWLAILTYQHRLFSEFEILYAPIVGATDDYQGHVPVETPEQTVARTSRLSTECDDLKRDLRDVLEQVDIMMIRPAQDARDNLQLYRKTIKRRDDKKLDYERYQGRVDTATKKKVRSDRDNQVLAKAESELAVATESYKAADDHLRDNLPSLLLAVYSLQPHLLAAQVNIQNSLLGHYYTSLHSYCTEEGFPNPAPPMDEVIRLWDDTLRPIQKEAEAIPILSSGKSVRKGLENGHTNNNNSNQPNGYRRPSQNSSISRAPSISPARPLAPAISNEPSRPKIASSPSTTSLLSPPITTPSESAAISPSPSSIPSGYATPGSGVISFSPAGPNTDYFSRDRQTSNSLTSATSHSPFSPATAAAAAAKKKPPPPPPRMNSQQFTFVTALYDFGGQGEGDLIFKEGDRIKVIKKTGSTDDWWQGELRGVKGMFPANYCS